MEDHPPSLGVCISPSLSCQEDLGHGMGVLPPPHLLLQPRVPELLPGAFLSQILKP